MNRHSIAAALAVVAALTCAACTRPIPGWEQGGATADVHSEALAVRQAADKAQATLGEFLVKAKEPPAGTTGYGLKVAVREGDVTEYFWVHEFTWSDGTFTGRINDEPRVVKRIKTGQMHRFDRSDIVDWTYVDERSGKTFGNFTACALSGSAPPAGAGEIKRRHDLDCS